LTHQHEANSSILFFLGCHDIVDDVGHVWWPCDARTLSSVALMSMFGSHYPPIMYSNYPGISVFDVPSLSSPSIFLVAT